MASMYGIVIAVFFIVFVHTVLAQLEEVNTVRNCIEITAKLRRFSRGANDNACLDCDPALPRCSSRCQPFIDDLYRYCDDVCLPDGYYHDPGSTLDGCWEDVKPEIKIMVERCGCDSAPQSHSLSISFAMLTATACAVWLWGLL